MDTGKLINKLSNRLRRRSKEIQKRIGISGAQGNVLDYILIESEKHPVYQKDIEEEFGLRPSTATELLSTLEKKGLITRTTDANDGRYKKIVFEERAADMKTLLRSEIENAEEVLLRGISEEERETFERIGLRMLQNLDSKELP